MIFEKEALTFRLLDVLRIDQSHVPRTNTQRHFDALSFRFRSDACLTTATATHTPCDGSVCFVPARVDYTHEATVNQLIVVHLDLLDYAAKDIEWFLPRETDKMAALFEEIWAVWQEKPAAYRHTCASILHRIFAECYRQNMSGKQSASKIQPSVDYIEKHFTDPELSVKELAALSHMSEVYFRKLFKEQFGVSPRKYLTDRRIQHAIGLMATEYYTLQEVAEAAGFADSKYFSVVFKKETGVSPSRYWYNYASHQSIETTKR